jgi:anti-sigma factor RsiW
MKCAEIRKALSAYQDGELDSARHAAIQNHLHSCPSCRSYYAELENTCQWLRQDTFDLHDSFLLTRIKANLAQLPDKGPAFPALNRWLAPIFVAAGLLLGIFLGNQLQDDLNAATSYDNYYAQLLSGNEQKESLAVPIQDIFDALSEEGTTHE